MKAMKIALLAGAMVCTTGFSTNWAVTVAETPGGHLIGNPEAETKLSEYISYTCGHCATFAREGEPVVKLVYVRSGQVSLEVRHLLRDPIDLTAAMLAHCGPADKFAQNHSVLMLKQSEWLPVAAAATPAQQQRWSNPDRAAARRAIASDLDFYEIMETRGYERIEVDRCLADSAKEAELLQYSRADTARLQLRGTPSFAIDDQLLGGVHSWQQLQGELDARTKPATTQGN